MDKEASDGQECGDGWRSQRGDVADRALLVDGETGESFPAQVKTKTESPHPWLGLACFLILGFGLSLTAQ